MRGNPGDVFVIVKSGVIDVSIHDVRQRNMFDLQHIGIVYTMHRNRSNCGLPHGTIVLALANNRVLINGHVYFDPYLLFTQKSQNINSYTDHIRKIMGDKKKRNPRHTHDQLNHTSQKTKKRR